MKVHLKLQQWWFDSACGVTVRKTPEDELLAIENKYDISIPEDFRDYLKEAAPSADNWDNQDGNWWPVSRLKSVADDYACGVRGIAAFDAAKHLVFLDYIDWCWAWAISCADDETRGKVALIGHNERYVADSFTEFVRLYLDDWDLIS